MEKIIFWGATGQAKVLKECIKHYNIDLIALFDNNNEIESPFNDIPLFPGEMIKKWVLQQPSHEFISYLVAIGGDRGRDRLKIHDYLKSLKLVPFKVIHPTAFVADNVKLGEGSQVLAHSSICVDTKIGRACIINTSSSVDHECFIDDGVHIGPGAHIAGSVRINTCAMVGTGATILPRLVIGKDSVVGAGAVVTKDVPDLAIVVGNPAKVIRFKSEVEVV
jgi:sugar O-acyltransferase (sialic acid O-acetyltransferase NeuD family)